MFRKLFGLVLLTGCACQMASAQELFPFTEPASNMPAKSIGIRLSNEGSFEPSFRNRSIAEAMVGFNKNLMLHAQAFFSDMDGGYRFEGGSLYAKYRFLAVDDVQSHFRMAAFGRLSSSNRPVYTRDINLEGDNSGWQAGIIATQLLHKLALSATVGYSKVFERTGKQLAGFPRPDDMLNYSLSSGYLVLPVVYKNYRQPSFNLYAELLGKTDPVNGNSYLDLAPAVQIILNSVTRFDLGYRFELAGGMAGRFNKNMYLAKVEFNFFNAFK